MENKITSLKLLLLAFLCCFSVAMGYGQDTVKLNPSLPGIKIPTDFTGMAYESDALRFDSLRAVNHTLIQFFKTAGVKVFRLGGNSVENFIFSPTSTTYHPPDTVTRRELDSLFAFAGAVGCKIILGINFGGNFNPTLAAEEASYVMLHYSNQLLAFEIGNEPNLYYRNGFRTPAYTYDSFEVQFLQYVDTIRKYTPNAPISGASAARLQAAGYTNPFAHDMKGIINLLTQHNYSIPQGMSTGKEIDSLLSKQTIDSIKYVSDTLVMLADSDSVPFRMDECNALYTGGQWGVSNSFTTALWALDYMYTLAESGVNGVNFHTTYDTNATIINDVSGHYSARAPYYGILAFQLNCSGRFLPYSSVGTAKNLDIFPVLDSLQNVYVTLINKDTLNPVPMQLYADSMVYSTGQMVSLNASSVSDTSGFTLAGNPVTTAGTWTSGPWTSLTASHGYFPLTIPAASAIIIKLNGPTLTFSSTLQNNQYFSLYPNPNNGVFTIKSSVSGSQVSVKVYNIFGQLIYSQFNIQHSQSNIDLSSQPNGIYFYKVISENVGDVTIGKFVIQK